MRFSLASRFLALALLGVFSLGLLDRGREDGAGGHPLPRTLALAGDLHRRGLPGPAGLLDEILLPLAPGGLREGLGRRVSRRETAENGAVQEAWEVRVAEEIRAVPGEERALLWALTLEPGYPEGLRALILRILDRGRDEHVDLALLVREGRYSTAWEAAVRLGRQGGPEAAEVLEEAVRTWQGWGRQYPIVGLVLLGDPRSAEVLREAAEDSSASVRRHVALGLGELGDLRDRPLLDDLARRLPDNRTLRAVLHAKARLAQRHPANP